MNRAEKIQQKMDKIKLIKEAIEHSAYDARINLDCEMYSLLELDVKQLKTLRKARKMAELELGEILINV